MRSDFLILHWLNIVQLKIARFVLLENIHIWLTIAGCSCRRSMIERSDKLIFRYRFDLYPIGRFHVPILYRPNVSAFSSAFCVHRLHRSIWSRLLSIHRCEKFVQVFSFNVRFTVNFCLFNWLCRFLRFFPPSKLYGGVALSIYFLASLPTIRKRSPSKKDFCDYKWFLDPKHTVAGRAGFRFGWLFQAWVIFFSTKWLAYVCFLLQTRC
jgi:hypothetical protein